MPSHLISFLLNALSQGLCPSSLMGAWSIDKKKVSTILEDPDYVHLINLNSFSRKLGLPDHLRTQIPSALL